MIFLLFCFVLFCLFLFYFIFFGFNMLTIRGNKLLPVDENSEGVVAEMSQF